MNKNPLIGIGICTVVLLVLGSLSNVVGYRTVQSSNEQIIKEEVNQRELLFQTLINIMNNKKLQRIILESQIRKGIFPVSNIPVLTKNQLRQMYFIGLILSKVFSKLRMQSIVGRYPFEYQGLQKEINAAIEKDVSLKNEITKVQNAGCDCGNTGTAYRQFPVLCTLLYPIYVVSFMSLLILADLSDVFNFQSHPICLFVFIMLLFVYIIIEFISSLLDCFFIYTPLEVTQ